MDRKRFKRDCLKECLAQFEYFAAANAQLVSGNPWCSKGLYKLCLHCIDYRVAKAAVKAKLTRKLF